MYKLLNKSIEWLVAIAVVQITTLGLFRTLVDTFEIATINSLLNYFSLLVMVLLIWYQLRHYGLKVYNKGFWLFYLVYCLYVLLDITIFRKYPLESLKSAPTSVFIYFHHLGISLGYLFCAPTIYHKFNLVKYILLSLLVCAIPSVLFAQYVGIEIIQSGLEEGDEGYINSLAITYANVPIIVALAVIFKKLLKSKWLSIIISSTGIALVLYVLLIYGKRGPMIWAFVNVTVCYLNISKNTKRYLLGIGIVVLSFVIFLDPIIDSVSEVLPRTGDRLERTFKEGHTAGRLDFNKPKHSTYLIGLENFSRSPIWGYYFRMDTNDQHFRGGYAHNVFIEMLMTMGIIGFIPLVVFLIKAYRKSRKMFKSTFATNQVAMFILFQCAFLELQTTGTIVFKNDFWLFLYILCCFDIYKNTNNKKTLSAPPQRWSLAPKDGRF